MGFPQPSALTELAGRYGVATEYEGADGRHVVVPEHTVVAVLEAMGVAAYTENERVTSLRAHEQAHWARPLPQVIVATAGAETPFWVHVPHGDPVRLWIRLEDGSVRTGLHQLDNSTPLFDFNGRLMCEATFELPADLPLGYHRLHLDNSGSENGAALIVAPATLQLPTGLIAQRVWALAVQLYNVRSQQSWGVGDLTDLADLATWAASRYGAGAVLVNPLHAAAPIEPMEPSPYLPTSRRFVNPLYLRPEAIPEFAQVRRRRRIRTRQIEAQAAADELDNVDRDGAWAAKRAALEEIYTVPLSAGRELAYQAFCDRHGQALDDFAIWCVLAEQFGSDWRQWPEHFQHPNSSEVADAAVEYADEVDFHRWLQWQLDDQLSMAQAQARNVGMALGFVHDLAVGVHPDGADAWALQDVLAAGVSAGAPPDAFNQQGQDWSQPPWLPDALAEREYEPFRAMVNATLRHSGGLRIDHIIGLFRLWWVPDEAPPTDGTYVHYDHDALVGIVTLEAHRAGALVVGEDLGTVEPWVRDYLCDRGVFGTSVLWFEMDREGGGGPVPAGLWREYCLSTVTTHDLPPTAGYLAGDHVRLRDELGLLTRPYDDEQADDRTVQAAWLAELDRVGLIDEDPDPDAIALALHRYLGRTPSRLLGMSLADAVGDRRTQNQPGTTDEYPNWQVPLCNPDGQVMLLEDVFTDPRTATFADAMRVLVVPAS